MAQATIKVADINGGEAKRNLEDGMTLGDLLSSGQQGLVNGTVMAGDTTLRAGDHVEVIAKSGKAGK